MINLQNLSVEQLRSVVAIKEQIERLEQALERIAGTRGPGRPRTNGFTLPSFGLKRRRLSADARARIAAGQRARWAKIKGNSSAAPAKASNGKPKRKVSAATKARLAAVARARWAKAKASGKSAL
jgi:hypothetical protein